MILRNPTSELTRKATIAWSKNQKAFPPCQRARTNILGSQAQAAERGSETNASQLKSQLRQTVSRLNNMSSLPSPSDKKELFQLVNALALENPTSNPEASTLLDGRWVLLYTISTNRTERHISGASSKSQEDQVFSVFQAASGLLYQLFYRFLPVLAGSAVGKRGQLGGPQGGIRSRGNFQVFDLKSQTVVNEARFDLFGRAGQITVWGTAEVVPKGGSLMNRGAAGGEGRGGEGGGGRGGGPSHLRAMFTRCVFALEGAPSLEVPLAVPNLLDGGRLQGPVGYVDTCYLDEEIRISTGDKGSLFIAVRQGDGCGGSTDGGLV